MSAGDDLARLQAVCSRWSAEMAAIAGEAGRMAYAARHLPELTCDRGLLAGVLAAVIRGGAGVDLRRATMFEDEFILYRSPAGVFSLRMFVYGPGVFTPVHDHNAWGVIGAAAGTLAVVRYRREDDGRREDMAQLREAGRLRLAPGAVDVTLPLAEGIHRTGNPDGAACVMLSVYGRPLRRLYIHCFDPDSGRVRRLYPPRIRRRKLAGLAYKALAAAPPVPAGPAGAQAAGNDATPTGGKPEHGHL